MIQERALKAVLVLVGSIFLAGVYPLTMFFGRDPALAMMLSLLRYTWGLFAARSAQPLGESRPL